MFTISGANSIAGHNSRAGTVTFTSVDPRTRTSGHTPFYEATPTEIDRAAITAAASFEITHHYTPSRLAEFLDRVAEEIEGLGEDLLTTADRETALGIPRLTGERARTTGQLRKFAALLREGSYVEAIIDPAQPDRQPAPRPDIRRMLFPIGPVAVFSASNFPFAFGVAGGDTASAFAAGCPVIVKGHPSHPATSELFAHAISRAVVALGFPSGFFSMLQGASIDVGQGLVQHPLIEAVAFTGSLRGGRALFDTAAQRPRPIPVYAEMGSINPVVILPGTIAARGETLASELVASVTLGAGQFCTKPGLVVMLDTPESRAFIDMVRQQMAQRDPGVLLNASVEQGLAHAIEHTLALDGTETLTGGSTVEGGGYCYANTVLATTSRIFRAEADLQAEHFGPVTLFVLCESFEDMQVTLTGLHGNLTASVHASDDEQADAAQICDVLREKVGRLIWNGFPTGVEVGYAMQHGGPYPATTAPASTSVGMMAVKRFLRPVAFQDVPDALHPDALKNANPLGIWRLVDGELTRDPITES